ncbi:ABC transporter ATP-binding protein [Virgibacillus sp. W0181]|uniref:ABC transporter ATP-binding protein n=1 Tax=Virgibacillus sp. W0181 TaxID=3391581 RepID=UPI003F450511
MFRLENIIVKDIFKINHLEINHSITCIVGQSGSGKSTLLRLLNNLDDPQEGKIYFNDTYIENLDPLELRKQVPMSPQTPVVFDGTIKDNLGIASTFTNEGAPADAILTKTLHSMHLYKDLHTHASDLSGGEKQRLALGRLLLMDSAKAFLLDEPSSSLDDQTTSVVMDKLAAHAKEKKIQIIMVTHNKELADRLADKVILMDEYKV